MDNPTSHLLQIKMPVDKILRKLHDKDIGFKYIKINPNELENLEFSQGVTFSNDVHNAKPSDVTPIWVADEKDKLKIIDGRHRALYAITHNIPLMAVEVKLNFNDAVNALREIIDNLDYEQHQNMEEVVGQDVINTDNQQDSGVSDSEFLSTLEEDNDAVQTETPSKNEKKIIAYRKDPIKEKSIVGNFFSLKPMEGFSKYEIEFDNLLDTNDLGIHYKDSQIPAEVLAKIWFPHVNFEKLAEEYNTTSINLKNKAICEKAHKMGFDGIKYGESLIQGLK